MKPLYLKVILFDPLSGEEYPVSDGIQVEIAEIYEHNPLVGFHPKRLKFDENLELFYIRSPRYSVSKDHYLRVGFKKVNFSKATGHLLTAAGISKTICRYIAHHVYPIGIQDGMMVIKQTNILMRMCSLIHQNYHHCN